jgi:hypothetical protein
MISAGSCMSRPRDSSYRNDGAHHAMGEVAQDHRAPGAPFCARNQGPDTVTGDRPATLALRAAERPLTGRFAGLAHRARPKEAELREGRGSAEARRSRACQQTRPGRQRRNQCGLIYGTSKYSLSPAAGPRTAADSCQEPALIIHRCHSPHHRVHHKNRYCLDDRHHRRCGRHHLGVARDGRSRGRRTQALLLAAGPDPAFVLGQEGGPWSAWVWVPGNATVRLPSRCAGRLAWQALWMPRLRPRRVACRCCAGGSLKSAGRAPPCGSGNASPG